MHNSLCDITLYVKNNCNSCVYERNYSVSYKASGDQCRQEETHEVYKSIVNYWLL